MHFRSAQLPAWLRGGWGPCPGLARPTCCLAGSLTDHLTRHLTGLSLMVQRVLQCICCLC